MTTHSTAHAARNRGVDSSVGHVSQLVGRHRRSRAPAQGTGQAAAASVTNVRAGQRKQFGNTKWQRCSEMRNLKKLVVPIALLFTCSSNAFAQDDVIFRALKDEMDRSLKQLKIKGHEAPYFLSYACERQRRC